MTPCNIAQHLMLHQRGGFKPLRRCSIEPLRRVSNAAAGILANIGAQPLHGLHVYSRKNIQSRCDKGECVKFIAHRVISMSNSANTEMIKLSAFLIADSKAYSRALLRSMLIQVGAKIIYEVGDGAGALDAIRNVNPDVLIVDDHGAEQVRQ